ncbi:hypothetical protein CLOM_g9726 [Closterium sp. NIES-68]|nr:hypothetical protein CLOM_g9726 [Closterium sp. NIES-68]GJP63319.1 hypothetical protein CLOP_g20391 [Closterium sp. NIES-67]
MPTVCKPLVVAPTAPLTASAIARALTPRILPTRTAATTTAAAVTALVPASLNLTHLLLSTSSHFASKADYTFQHLSLFQPGSRQPRSHRVRAAVTAAITHPPHSSTPSAAMVPPTIVTDADPHGGVSGLSTEAPSTAPPQSAKLEAMLVDETHGASPETSAPFKKQRIAGSTSASDAPAVTADDSSADPPAPAATSAATTAVAAAAVSAPANAPPSLPAALPAYVPPPHAEAAWAHFRRLGSPRLLVAPMVDQSELPFRRLCAKYGAQGAYTPMFHSRLFVEDHKYRREFTTCAEDRPLFVQFCANNPDTLVKAASLVAADCDYIDINFGCPQRIARRGRYGAFLMDDLPLIESLVSALSAARLPAPVSCKIRIFPDLARTIAYARMLEAAGCYLLAVHGRTREQKDGKKVRADWEMIRRVKEAVSIPVIANGNIRDLSDVLQCLEATGADGVLSAESLLENPALFGGYRVDDGGEGGEEGGEDDGEEGRRVESEAHAAAAEAAEAADSATAAAAAAAAATELAARITTEAAAEVQRLEAASAASGAASSKGRLTIDRITLAEEYLALCDSHPVPMRMVRSHLHRMLGPVFSRHPHVREKLNKEYKLTVPWLQELVGQLKACERGEVGEVVAAGEGGAAAAVAAEANGVSSDAAAAGGVAGDYNNGAAAAGAPVTGAAVTGMAEADEGGPVGDGRQAVAVAGL